MFGFDSKKETYNALDLIKAFCELETVWDASKRPGASEPRESLYQIVTALAGAMNIREIADIGTGTFLRYQPAKKIEAIYQHAKNALPDSLSERVSFDIAAIEAADQRNIGFLERIFHALIKYRIRIAAMGNNVHPFVEGDHPPMVWAASTLNDVSFQIEKTAVPLDEVIALWIDPMQRKIKKSKLIESFGFPNIDFCTIAVDWLADEF